MFWGAVGLRSNQLFHSLTEYKALKLAPAVSTASAEHDSVLFTEGGPATHLYLISQGQVSLQKRLRAPRAARPRRVTIAICGGGDLVGWSALVQPNVCSVSAVVWVPSRLLRVDVDMPRSLLESYPRIGFKVMKELSAIISLRLKQTIESLVTERQLNGLFSSELEFSFNARQFPGGGNHPLGIAIICLRSGPS